MPIPTSDEFILPNAPSSPSTLAPSEDMGENHAHHLVMVGGGPRSVIQTNAEILFMILYRDHFDQLQRLGAHYDIQTTIMERQPRVGVGSAYGGGQTGMMNTGIEDPISFPIPTSEGTETLHILKHFLSYAKRYEQYVESNADQYFEDVKKLNLPGAFMFKTSVGPDSFSKSGHLDHNIAYLMRKTAGDEELSTFNTIRDLASGMLPFYKLNILTSHEVKDIKASSFGLQQVTAKALSEEISTTLHADQVRINTGTILKNPAADERVADFTFCQPMNVNHFKEYCVNRNLLASDGTLKKGLRVISGGIGLSGLDQLIILDGVMNMFEEDPSAPLGYRVTENAKKKYPNAITIVNRTPGKTVYPRHAFTEEWQQDTPVMSRTEHLHALALHNHGEEVFTVWLDILTATVSRSMRETPGEVGHHKKGTEETFRLQYEETKKFMYFKKLAGNAEVAGDPAKKDYYLREAMKTLYGSWRQATLAFLFGYGLEEDIEATKERMYKLAPLTWKGRQTWLFARTHVDAVTDPEFGEDNSNWQYFQNWKNMYHCVASSPVEIQSMFHLLIDAGIANYQRAEYQNVQYDQSTGRLKLHDENYDLFIVSPTYESSEDRVGSLISKQMKPYIEANTSFGKVGKFRRFEDKNGERVPIEMNGIGGLGYTFNKNNVHSRIGSFAIDLNDRSSATNVASSFTLRRMAVAHMKAAGIEDAEQKLDVLYEMGKPTETAFNEEVSKFEPYYQEAHEMRAYMKAIEAVCGEDGNLFCELFDDGLTKEARSKKMMELMNSSVEVERAGAKKYFEMVKNIPEFTKPTKKAFYERGVDTTDYEDANLYKEAFKLAKKHLMSSSN